MPITCQKLDECYYKFTFSCLLYGFASSNFGSTFKDKNNWLKTFKIVSLKKVDGKPKGFILNSYL